MSHPVPGHDYSERTKYESRKEYANRKGTALGKKENFPKDYVDSKRGLRKALKKINKTNGRAKALNKAKEN